MGPLRVRLYMSSQLTPSKKGCCLTRPAPPLMLPSRLERSMVQKERMMFLALSEMGGSWGNRTGFSTILQKVSHWAYFRRGSGESVLSVDLDGILMPEWRIAGQELIDQNAQSPPVHCRRVALVMDHLGGEVLGRAAKRVSLHGMVPIAAEALGKAKVDQLDVPVLVDEQVLGLEVSVGDAALLLVQVLQHEDDLGGVEAGDGLVEAPKLAEVGEELAAGDVVEEHVEGVVVGEGAEEVGDEGVAGDVGEDGALVAHVLNLLQLYDVRLSEDLECVDFWI